MDCLPCCDYCEYYIFNGENGVYTEEGWCWKHSCRAEPDEECNEFVCGIHGKK